MRYHYPPVLAAIPALIAFLATAAIAAPAGPPTVNIAKTCRTSTDEIVKLFGDTTVVSFDACLKQQNEAHQQMRKNWYTYTAADKSHCVQSQAYMPSYVEWLTCFEMELGVRQIRAEESNARRDKTVRPTKSSNK